MTYPSNGTKARMVQSAEHMGMTRATLKKMADADYKAMEVKYLMLDPSGEPILVDGSPILKDQAFHQEALIEYQSWEMTYASVLEPNSQRPTIARLAEAAGVNEQTVRKLIQDIFVMVTGKALGEFGRAARMKSSIK